MAGLPPAYLKLGKSVIYEEAELDRFLATCRRQSTSEPDRLEENKADAPPGPRAAVEPSGGKIGPKLARLRRANVTDDPAGRGSGQ
jgi:hypothetical protein